MHHRALPSRPEGRRAVVTPSTATSNQWHQHLQKLPPIRQVVHVPERMTLEQQQRDYRHADRYAVGEHPWSQHETCFDTEMSDLDVRLRIETSPCSSIEESDVFTSCQEGHRTRMDIVGQPSAEAVRIDSQPKNNTVNAGGLDDEQRSREKKNDASGADRSMLQAQLQVLEDILQLHFNWSAQKKQSDNNAARSGLQGDKKEVVAVAIAILDIVGTMKALEELRGDASTRDLIWPKVCQEAANNIKSESALPPRSIMRGPDNRQCNNGRTEDKDGSTEKADSDRPRSEKKSSDKDGRTEKADSAKPKAKKKNTAEAVGACVLHEEPDSGLKPGDYRGCRLHIRKQNAERHLRQLLSCPWNDYEELWEKLGTITKMPSKL